MVCNSTAEFPVVTRTVTGSNPVRPAMRMMRACPYQIATPTYAYEDKGKRRSREKREWMKEVHDGYPKRSPAQGPQDEAKAE